MKRKRLAERRRGVTRPDDSSAHCRLPSAASGATEATPSNEPAAGFGTLLRSRKILMAAALGISLGVLFTVAGGLTQRSGQTDPEGLDAQAVLMAQQLDQLFQMIEVRCGDAPQSCRAYADLIRA